MVREYVDSFIRYSDRTAEGGFIRGNKEHRENIGRFLAQHGFVTVLANYRLAPESRWPSGPEDVVGVWQWLQQHGASHGADPSRVALMGESAGTFTPIVDLYVSWAIEVSGRPRADCCATAVVAACTKSNCPAASACTTAPDP